MTRKITNFIKQYFFVFALVGLFVGFSAFKYAERFDDPVSGWYEISIDENDPNNPTKQIIIDFLENGPENDCAPLNTEEPCAVHLDLELFPEETNILGLRVSNAIDTLEAELDKSVSPTGYARRDE